MYTTLHLLVWFPNNSSEIIMIWHGTKYLISMWFAKQLNLEYKVYSKLNQQDSIS